MPALLIHETIPAAAAAALAEWHVVFCEEGVFTPGKQIDAVVVADPVIDLIRAGAETVRSVIKKGHVATHAG